VAKATVRDNDRYLVCRTAAGRRIAMPLGLVRRLENFPAGELESVGVRKVVRRGDAFTPVVDADGLLGSPSAVPADTVRLVVVGDDDGSIGLAVEQILDVESADTPLQPSLASGGVAGSLSLGGIATEVLDLDSARIAGRA
jgi:two-component system chemotaxis sensor kinase CheA